MKRFLPLLLVTAALTVLAGIWLPWWSCALAAALTMFFLRATPGGALWGGFFGVFLAWIVWASALNAAGDGLVAERMAALFGLPAGWLMLLASGLVGGLVGALGGLAGKFARDMATPATSV